MFVESAESGEKKTKRTEKAEQPIRLFYVLFENNLKNKLKIKWNY